MQERQTVFFIVPHCLLLTSPPPQPQVTDTNDNLPLFGEAAYSFDLWEDTQRGAQVGAVSAVDADLGLNRQVSYSVLSDWANDVFSLNPQTGVFTLTSHLDYELYQHYVLVVQAQDSGTPSLSSTATVYVNVLDLNDNAPLFDPMSYSDEVLENVTVGSSLLRVSATDLDSGDNGRIVYSIAEGDPDGQLAILANGTIVTRLPLDRERKSLYSLVVRATDQAPEVHKRLSSSVQVTIVLKDVNDMVPEFVTPNVTSVQENAPANTIVMAVKAVDRDEGRNSYVEYSVSPEHTFSLGPVDGLLRVRGLLDREQRASYELLVTARDRGHPVRVASQRLRVRLLDENDNSPVFDPRQYSAAVSENSSVGASVLRVSATDQDEGASGQVRYSIIAGDPNHDFSVGQDTGVLRVTVTVLDRNDSPPRFQNGPYTISLSEDAPVGSTVAVLQADDPDLEGSVRFSIAEGQSDAGHFRIDPQTGALLLVEALDRELQAQHLFSVTATDGLQSTEALVSIEVTDTNDNLPLFGEAAYSFDLWEDTQRGAQVGAVSAVDADLGLNRQVSYSVLSDWANDVFSLNPQTGVFTLTSHLDYELYQHYVLVVQAQDSGTPSLSSTATVYVNVLDLNDNAPLFDPMSYSDEVLENVTVGSSLLRVSATDLDSGDNGRIVYSIAEGDPGGQLAILANGTIVTRLPLDRERKSLYSLVVRATDQAPEVHKRLSSSVQVTIVLKDVNDMVPEFVTPNVTSVQENAPANTIVMAVKAVDRDEGRNSYVEYSVSPEHTFSLGPVDGLLRVRGLLDREQRASYELLVTARDRGHPVRVASQRLRVRLLDENDNSPVFDPRQYSAAVSENSSVGASVLRVSATDQDEGASGQVRYSIIAGDPNHDFSVGQDTGVLRVRRSLDYERRTRYLLTLQAEDCAGASSELRFDTATVTISVTDVNDNAPAFLDSPYELHVVENAATPVVLLTLAAHDADQLPSGPIHYRLEDLGHGAFRINGTSGELSLERPLDRELRDRYLLTVLAVDSGNPRQTGTGTVSVFVSDVNDNAPEFDRSRYVASLAENQPADHPVTRITATDADVGRNARIRYSLHGEQGSRFSVDAESGLVRARVPMDREECERYELRLVAHDDGLTVRHSATVELVVLVTDQNDNRPTFASANTSVVVPSGAEPGHFVLGARATDADSGPNGQLVFHLSGPDVDKFQIQQDTGVIRLAHRLASSSPRDDSSYEIQVHATDQGRVPLVSSMTVFVSTADARQFPKFRSSTPGMLTLAEGGGNGVAPLATLSATSPKKGPAGRITYRVASGGNAFALHPDSGVLTVIRGDALDLEATPRLQLWLEARDADEPALSSAVRIDVQLTDINDNVPEFERDVYNTSVREEQSAGQLVAQLHARDGDSGVNGKLRYELRPLPTSRDFDDLPFEIDAATGELRTTARLDRETVAHYRFLVEARDEGDPSLTGTATVLVSVSDKNDNPPRFTRLFSVNVTENAPLGAFVIQVTSSDRDAAENANATYSFTENPGERFAIDPLTGNVTVAGPLDRELRDEYLLKVAAVDGSWKAETPLTVSLQDVNDNAPRFERMAYRFRLPELQSGGSFVGRVAATDADKTGPNAAVSYSLRRPSDLFRVDPATGEVLSKQPLRYRRSPRGATSPENQHVLRVLATDHGKPPLSSETTVYVSVVDANNHVPKFEQTTYFSPLPDNAAVGLSVVRVTARDDQDVGVNAELMYSIFDGNGTDLLDIHQTSGWLTVAKPLPRQQGQMFALKVRATDQGVPPKSADTVVSVTITGENQFSPVFTALSYQIIIPENEPVHSELLTVSATDADSGLNGEVRYSIESGNTGDSFAMEPHNGALTISAVLDYETVPEFRLNVSACDAAFHRKCASATLTVIVTDVNDCPPQFNATHFDAYVAENEPPGTTVTQLSASDADSGRNRIVQYALVGGSSDFAVDPQSGVVTAQSSFDYEQTSEYVLEVVASNPGSLQYSSCQLRVHVTGKNEFFPRFVQPVFQFAVSESTVVGTAVGRVLATDEDSGPEGDVYFLFVGSSNDRGFRIQPSTGVITVSRTLDREAQARVVLSVMAKNGGSIRGNDTDEAQVVVSIQDGNDPPVFLQPLYEARISEAAPVGSPVLSVSAVDRDVRPNNHQFFYSILEGDPNKVFGVDSQTGLLHTAAPLDRESVPSYTLTLAAIDRGSPPQTGTATVRVTLDDVNDNGPEFEPADLLGYVLEDEPPYTSVLTLAARDRDLAPNGAPFAYSLVGGARRNLFELDRQTGVLRTTQRLDREATPSLQLLVEVQDSGNPPIRARHGLTVLLVDKNDSPSSPRSLTVLVWVYHSVFAGGKIADVRPLDPDATGEYQCRLESRESVFSIVSQCDLHASRLLSPSNYSFTVRGNDGYHQDVTSTVNVQFRVFDNATVENSVSLRVVNQSAGDFLGSSYDRFLGLLRQVLEGMGSPIVYSMADVKGQLQLTLAVRKSSGILVSPDKVSQRLEARRDTLQSSLAKTIVVGYEPCASSPCRHGGTCSSRLDFQTSLSILDSAQLVFASPGATRSFACSCPVGFSGLQCQDQLDPCSPSPCSEGSTCRIDAATTVGFQCLCPEDREGERCERPRRNSCASAPCKNGGSCREAPAGSFFCLCRLGFKGSLCEQAADGCRPSRCRNGATCVGNGPAGYHCLCEPNFFGRHCEKSTFGFEPYSYMAFPSLKPSTNDISVVFATNRRHALLAYNFGAQNGGRSDFVALEIADGRPTFSFGGSRTAVAKVALDRDVADGNWHRVTVIRNGRTGTGTVSVFVSDVNDNAPEFDRSRYVASLAENQPADHPVTRITATDADVGRNARIRYSLHGEQGSRFSVDAESGLVRARVPMDREECERYELRLVAHDDGLTVRHSATVELVVLVTDQNDNRPTFASANTSVVVPSGAEPGHFVLGARATDADSGPNGQLVFHLSGPDVDKFQIQQDTGVIRLAHRLASSSPRDDSSYEIQVHATDQGRVPLVSSMTVFVSTADARQFPKFRSSTPGMLTLAEGGGNGVAPLATLSATSPKKGPAGRITYRVASGGNAFALHPDSGVLTVIRGDALDLEATPRLQLWLEARDADEPALSSAVRIDVQLTDVNDNVPEFERDVYNTSVREEQSAGQLVAQLHARDGDSGVNGKLRYELRPLPTSRDFDDLPFEIDAATGELRTTARLDRETVAHYRFLVEARDEGDPSLTGTATVLVSVSDKNDNPPRFTRLFSVNVTENAPLGAFVIQVTSSDRDAAENANATYSFTENPGERFAIDPLTGNVTVAGPLDRELRDEYLLKVAAVDGSWKAETPLTVSLQDVNDNAPRFERMAYRFRLPELQSGGSFVGRVAATDADKTGPNAAVSYSLRRPSDLFRVDPATGEVLSKQPLRYRRSPRGATSPENQHVLRVLATDHGKPPLSSETTVYVSVVDANNHVPKFEQTTYFSPLPDNAAVGLSVVRVTARDDQDVGVNAELMYSIFDGNGTDLLDIHQTSGWLTVAKPLPRQQGQMFALKVRATDQGVPPKSADTVVSVTITGENQFSPVFTALSYQIIIPENEPVHSELLTVSATDADSGLNGEVRYSIESGNTGDSFAMEPHNGALTISAVLDYETVPEFRLNVSACDAAFHRKCASATLTVIVTDVNDCPPQFNATHFDAYVAENEPPGTTVTQLSASDADSGRNRIVQYALVGGSSDFAVDPQSGVVTAQSSFDYEQTSEYVLEVVASNPGSLQYSSCQLRVHVTGKNEFFPRFVQPVFQFAVSESTVVGTAVGRVLATDEDSGPEGDVYFLFVGSSNDRGFRIQPSTGVITVSRTLDREAQARVVLSVMAKNGGSIRGNDTDEAQVVVSIQDGNDPPVFLQPLYEARISEAAPVGSPVLSVSAVDRDVRPNNHQFFYSILEGDPNKVFGVDSQTGLLHTAAPLDRESVPSYTLTLAAIDRGSPPQTGTATVRVTLDDVNDNGPEFEPADLLGYVLEDEPPYTSVLTLAARDRDLAPNGAPFAYSLVGGARRNLFELDRQTGVLRTTQRLDREATPSLQLLVEVQDSGNPPIRARHGLTVLLVDKNDSPSSPRSLTVLVWVYHSVFAGGKIADVRPLDPDATGEYQCRLESRESVFSIVSQCDLHASRLLSPSNYSFTVRGNDGYHQDVTSTVNVQFRVFDNATVENSVSLRVVNQSAGDFLGSSYDRFLGLLRQVLEGMGSPIVYSMADVKGQLQLTLAVRKSSGILVSPDKVSQRLEARRDTLQSSLAKTIVVGYEPCASSPCRHGGTCSSRLDFQTSLSILDSAQLVFASPGATRSFACSCPVGFSGLQCQDQLDPCSPSPCSEGSTCRIDAATTVGFQCLCPEDREGERCERPRRNSCASAPCKNGGSCREAPAGSFFCLCRLGFKGSLCEQAADGCRPSRCRNGATCVGNGPAGYHCLCEPNFFGRHCEKSTFGFEPYSYMAFPSLKPSTNDISVVFATNRRHALLAYNFGAQNGGRSDFVALEIADGRPTFSFGGSRTAVAKVALDRDVADGNWHRVTVIRNGRVASLSVVSCQDHGELCEECSHANSSCSLSVTGQAGTLSLSSQPLYIGGLPSVEPLLERPSQVWADDFVGCVHSVAVDGQPLALERPLRQQYVARTCGRRGDPCATGGCRGANACRDLWSAAGCTCPGGMLVAQDCGQALEPYWLSGGSFLELVPQEKHRREALVQQRRRQQQQQQPQPQRASRDLPPSKALSLRLRTLAQDGLLLHVATERDHTRLQLAEGHLEYLSQSGQQEPVQWRHPTRVSDGHWHQVVLSRTLETGGGAVSLTVDDQQRRVPTDASLHDFLDPFLTSFTIGGRWEQNAVSAESLPGSLQGCVQQIAVNGELQSVNASQGYFRLVARGAVGRSCSQEALRLDVAADPLGVGIILVIAFFVVLILVILVSLLVFRRCKLKRHKAPTPIKPNGNALINQITEATRGSVHTEPGYADGATPSAPEEHLRNPPSAQDLVPPKRAKERDIGSDNHLPRTPQRPDIIEREVMHASSPLAASRCAEQSVYGAAAEPEHYDLENASSIAPSDIDIVYHYRVFRDGSQLRKLHHNKGLHKHPGPHRHSPASPTARQSPRQQLLLRPAARDSPSALKMHHSTPLARLSPSSELSRQTPRILTLQDISGKPLQTALLASAHPGNGAKPFKDALTNSERSLNSPVSQLSRSTGSLPSAKLKQACAAPAAESRHAQPLAGLGLTAEEIECLNARPRNCSLVSTLDAVSSSGSEGTKGKLSQLLDDRPAALLDAATGHDSSSDESGNDSFTCSEFEYDNGYEKAHRDFAPGNMIFSKLAEEDNENDEDSSKTYDGFDSFRGSLSTLVASDDDLSHLSYKPPSGAVLGWDCLLNWGPNFENLVGVFKDIADLPDTVSPLTPGHPKPSEEYV
ncbi:cadherin-related tumor suppressor [Ixodes scapularis]